jgi:hypothetical protein
MNNNKNILGCFVSNSVESEWNEFEQNRKFEQGKLFRLYIWGEKGIDKSLKLLNNFQID